MSEQFDLFAEVQARYQGVGTVQKCHAKYGKACVLIYAKDMTSVVRAEDCRDWCPLLKERVE